MTKKDFNLIALVIMAQRNDKEESVMLDTLARDFARVFALQNSRFDQLRFLKACGLDSK